MCMKFINVAVSCYQSVAQVDNSIISLNAPFDRIIPDSENSLVSIGNFFVVTHINLLGTNDEKNKIYSVLEKGENLDVIVRLTKCDIDENNQRYRDLDCFTIDLQDEENKKNIHRACFPYFNYKRITKIEPFKLPLGTGLYVIKVLVKESSQGEDDYTIQSMSHLLVEPVENIL